MTAPDLLLALAPVLEALHALGSGTTSAAPSRAPCLLERALDEAAPQG